MTNNIKISTINELASEFIVDDQDELNSPIPESVSEAYGGIAQDFREDTVFMIDIEADSKQPGTLTGEKCPMSDIIDNSYEYLYTQYPHWRRLLADEYMRNTKLDDVTSTAKTTAQLVLLHIDEHAWASIVHYLTATKFSQTPEIYNKLCLDSGDAMSQLPVTHIKTLSQKLPIQKDMQKDWIDNRKVDSWRRALLAKFAQNEDLQRALILTGWAKLVNKHEAPLHLLMWVRTVLRGDQQPQSMVKDVNVPEIKLKDEKSVEEVLGVIEGLFGKDKQQLLSSLFNNGEAKKVVEAKRVEMKDAVGYLEQIRKDEPPETFNEFLKIMTDFRSEKINTPQVLERVTLLFKGKSWLIRNFLMFLPPGHILDLTPENNKNSIYITSPNGKKIVIDIDKGTVTFE